MEYLNILGHWEGWVYLLILSALEIVLGIDNIIFISIVTDKLNGKNKRIARNTGLTLALIIRLGLLAAVSWVMQLIDPLFTVFGQAFTGQGLVLIAGGLFLIYKSTIEMHKSVKGEEEASTSGKTKLSAIIMQIVIIDVIFSFDSIISAVGMTNGIQKEVGENPIAIIFLSVIISMIVMLIFAAKISKFISDNPTIKMIALSFLVTVGVLLIAEAFGQHIPKGYVYFALVYSLSVEMLNIKRRKNTGIDEQK